MSVFPGPFDSCQKFRKQSVLRHERTQNSWLRGTGMTQGLSFAAVSIMQLEAFTCRIECRNRKQRSAIKEDRKQHSGYSNVAATCLLRGASKCGDYTDNLASSDVCEISN